MRKHLRRAAVLLSLYLGLHNGYIALWNTNSAQPERVFPYRAVLYPKIDQSQLSEGIPISDEEHLMRLLQDFMS